ncbi:MAG: SAM-dependent methyltransferase, partial [Actinomycetota bacterium]
LVSWTPEGFIGQMFATMKPYVAPPPPGAQPPPLWGKEDHVLGLFGDRVVDVRTERRTVRVDRFATPEEFRDFFKANYSGPVGLVGQSRAVGPDMTTRGRRRWSARHGATGSGPAAR